MKTTHSLFLLLAGIILTAALFSFKTEEPKKEFMMLINKTTEVARISPEGTETAVEVKPGQNWATMTIQMNLLAKEGWAPIMTSGGSANIITLGRVKQ